MIDLKKMVVITGLPGVFKLIGSRPNGLIVEDYDTKKRKFVSSRKHQFTPLESISIYTTGEQETVPLADVFQKMKDKLEEIPLPTGKFNEDQGHRYIGEVLPDYDPDQVYFSDIKKLVKWFSFLNSRQLLVLEAEDENFEEEAEIIEESTENAGE